MHKVAAVAGVAIVGVVSAAVIGSVAGPRQRVTPTTPQLGSRSTAGLPKWATEVARTAPEGFFYRSRGATRHPRVASVSYREGRRVDTVTVVFDRVVACGVCSWPARGSAPRGTTLKAFVSARDHRAVGFSFG